MELTAHLYAPLHQQLLLLLESLTPDDWRRPTVCRGWEVRDIAAHLLDVDIRRLSFLRDDLEVPAADSPISTYADLVTFLNRLNAAWVEAARRVSPRLLIDFLRLTGPQVADHVAALDMMAPARFPVGWAGEEASLNWFDVARDYTERWHHQQQIRDAVGAQPLTSAYWFSPVLNTFMRALPHHYRNVAASKGDVIEIRVEGEAGGHWTLIRDESTWQLQRASEDQPAARITLTQDTAWRLFTKGLRADQAKARIQIEGAANLAEPFRQCLAVMAL